MPSSQFLLGSLSMAVQTQKDIFISSSAYDWNWAQWLDYVLRKAGYTTALQGFETFVDKSFVAFMDEALVECRLVACLLSPEYLQSNWCKEQWPAGLFVNQLCLIRVAQCEPAGLLGPRAFLDWVGATEVTSKELLLNALKEWDAVELRRPTDPDWSHENSFTQPQRFPRRLPAIWNIRERRNPCFTGRNRYLHSMHEALSAGNTCVLTPAVTGLGGEGKTQLALEYAYRYAGEYDGIWWLRAEQPVTLRHDYATLASKLGFPEVRDQVQLVAAVRDELSRRNRFLLVFDNATDPDTIEPYLPPGSPGHVIVTTRSHNWAQVDLRVVNRWSLESAVTFLLKRINDTDAVTAKELAARLGCLPLALEHAAAYMEICGRSFKDYLQLLEKHGLGLVEKGKTDPCENTVGVTWSLSFEQVQRRCPPAADLFNLCSVLAPDAIDMRDLAAVAEKLPARLAATLKDDRALNDARAALLSFSLVSVEGDRLSVHRLVREVARNRLASDARDEWQKAALAVVNAIFPQESYDVRTWPTCAAWLAQALYVTSLKGSAALSPRDTSRLLNQAGLYLKNRADYAQAELLYRRALKIDEATLGANHSEVANRLNNLALLLQDTNRPSEAESLLRRALGIDEANFGLNHPSVAVRLNNLALLLQDTNRLGEAESLLRRALGIDEANFDPNHPDLAIDLNNLASLLQDTKRPGEAEPLMRRSLTILEACMGAEHPNTITVRRNLELLLTVLASEP
jgi:tetratricopeptide (TPR) repeat protein